MIISVTLNKQTKEIVSGPEILTRGFVYVKDSYDLINEIKEISKNIILDNTLGMKYIEYNKIKNTIRDELSKYLVNQTGNKPMIITVMQEI
jgi:ribonuclease J